MYRNFYRFSKYPFCNTPDTGFFFEFQNHSQALTFLEESISEKRGFAAILGEDGSGKTFISRKLINLLDETAEVGWIPNTCLREEDFLKAICEEFKLPTQDKTEADLFASLNDFFVKAHSKNKDVVLLVDEAQNLSSQTLEKIKKLSESEIDKKKLIQIIFLGQPELRKVLEKSGYELNKDQIDHLFQLKPLNILECADYIQYRLHVAGNQNPKIFNQRAMELIYKASKGFPRKINNLCDNALLNGFVQGTPLLNAKIIDKVVQDFGFVGSEPEFPKRSIVSSSLTIVAASVIVILGLVQFFKDPETSMSHKNQESREITLKIVDQKKSSFQPTWDQKKWVLDQLRLQKKVLNPLESSKVVQKRLLLNLIPTESELE